MKCYTILRESSEPQERKKGLARQRRQIARFTETWPGGPHQIYEPCPQVIESASQGSRREWLLAVNRGIELCRQGLTDAFLFAEVDRETRNPLISVPILRLVLDAGIPAFFAEESLHLDPAAPRSINRYSEAVAKACAYVDVFVQKTRAGRFDRANEDGLLPSNTRMFGFDIVDGRRVVNVAQATALRHAGDIVLAEGRSGPAARWLSEQGWRTTHGRPFSPTSLACSGGTLRNRALVGETVIHFAEKQVVIRHAAILDEAKFAAINAVLDGRRLREPRSVTFYALTGIVSCGCGAKWEVGSTRGYGYYRCASHCGEKSKRKEVLEGLVSGSFGVYLKERRGRADYLELARQSEATLSEELDKIERDVEANTSEWRSLLAKDLAGYPAEVVKEKKAELNAARESLQWRKAEIEGQLLLLPQVDPNEVEQALATLGEPWLACDWSTPASTPHDGLPREQGELLRRTLLRLGGEVRVERGEVRITGRLPLGTGVRVGAKKGTSGGIWS
ncbi:MAG: recombinase family protein [Chloroflexota bacterium]|nr:recombinase family protein [Chloroflexota bacterium]